MSEESKSRLLRLSSLFSRSLKEGNSNKQKLEKVRREVADLRVETDQQLSLEFESQRTFEYLSDQVRVIRKSLLSISDVVVEETENIEKKFKIYKKDVNKEISSHKKTVKQVNDEVSLFNVELKGLREYCESRIGCLEKLFSRISKKLVFQQHLSLSSSRRRKKTKKVRKKRKKRKSTFKRHKTKLDSLYSKLDEMEESSTKEEDDYLENSFYRSIKKNYEYEDESELDEEEGESEHDEEVKEQVRGKEFQVHSSMKGLLKFRATQDILNTQIREKVAVLVGEINKIMRKNTGVHNEVKGVESKVNGIERKVTGIAKSVDEIQKSQETALSFVKKDMLSLTNEIFQRKGENEKNENKLEVLIDKSETKLRELIRKSELDFFEMKKEIGIRNETKFKNEDVLMKKMSNIESNFGEIKTRQKVIESEIVEIRSEYSKKYASLSNAINYLLDLNLITVDKVKGEKE